MRPLAIVGLVFVPLSLIAVALRCYSRYAVARQFGYDDFIMVVAAVFLIALVVLALYSTTTCFGRHLWDIDPLKVTELLKVLVDIVARFSRLTRTRFIISRKYSISQ